MRLRDRPVAVLTWLRDRGLVMPLAVLVAALMLFVSEGGYQRTRGSLDAAIEALKAAGRDVLDSVSRFAQAK